jgi:hypothetical protein
MTAHTAFERRLANRSDSYVLRGKLLLNSATSGTAGTVTNLLQINPGNFGARAQALSLIFARYRVNYLGFRFTAYGSTNNFVSIGVLDDATATEGDAPTTVPGVQELRCSNVYLQTTTVPEEFVWRPLDRGVQYYCQPGAAGSDPRLVNMGEVLYGSFNVTQAVTTIIDYEIRFEGAVDVGAL